MILSNKPSAKHIPDKSSSSKKKRGRLVGVKNKNNSTGTGTTLPADTSPPVSVEKQPGDVSFPLTSWSLTITRSGGDIHTSLLDNMNQLLHDVCTRGWLFKMKIIV